MKLGSLFDGIGGWQIAAVSAGIEPVWSSEIETFPIEVTKRRFPNTKQLGDITKIDGSEIEPVDIITSGSPCQDFSVANAERNGLDGTRSGLWFHANRIVRQMRMSTGGAHCRFYILENVPGILSSNKGMDFRTILATITECEIPVPRSGKWANAGLVRSRRCDVGWRILDAQYFRSTQGNFLLPQRRRRLWFVADFAESGRCAEKILFECNRLQGDNQQKCQARQDPSSNIEKSIRTTDRIVHRGGTAFVKIRSGFDDGNAGKGALIGMDASFTLGCHNDQTLFQDVSTVGGQIYDMTHADDVVREYKNAPTLNARMGTGGNQVPILTESIPKTVIMGHDERSAHYNTDVTDPLTVCDYKQPQIVAQVSNGGAHQAYAIGNGQTMQLTMQDKVGTLNCMHDQIAVMQKIATEQASSAACVHMTDEDSTDKMCRTES